MDAPRRTPPRCPPQRASSEIVLELEGFLDGVNKFVHGKDGFVQAVFGQLDLGFDGGVVRLFDSKFLFEGLPFGCLGKKLGRGERRAPDICLTQSNTDV